MNPASGGLRNVGAGYELQSDFNSRTRIQEIAERIPDKVEREYGEHHRQCGKEDEMVTDKHLRVTHNTLLTQ